MNRQTVKEMGMASSDSYRQYNRRIMDIIHTLLVIILLLRILPFSLKFTSLALGQFCNFSSAFEEIPKDINLSCQRNYKWLCEVLAFIFHVMICPSLTLFPLIPTRGQEATPITRTRTFIKWEPLQLILSRALFLMESPHISDAQIWLTFCRQHF